MKKLLLLLLCLSMLLSVTAGLASCNKNGDRPTGGDNDTLGEIDETDPEAVLYEDLAKVNYAEGGTSKEFNILNAESDWGLVTMDTDNIGTALDSAIYSRNRYVEEQLGILINVTQAEYHQVNDNIYNLVASNMYQYDICYNQSWKQTALVLNGVYMSANEYDQYLDFSKPWWYSDVLSDMTIANNLYLISGDMNMMLNDSLWCLAFNVDIITDHNAESPYRLVESGEWTYEKLYTLSKDTREEGKYGIVSHIALADALIIGADLALTVKNEDGIISRNPIDDRFTTIYQTMVTYFFENNGMGEENAIRTAYDSENYTGGKFNTSFNQQNEFTTGNATFLGGTVGDMRVYLPSSEVEYGIVPIPKYEQSQKQYISYVYRAASICGIPSNIDQQAEGTLARVCNVMEWLNAYSYKLVKPVYYDVILYGRISRQPEAVDMLKIIFGLEDNGVKRMEMDGVLALGMTNVLEVCASDCSTGISGRIRVISELVDDTLNTTVKYYQNN